MMLKKIPAALLVAALPISGAFAQDLKIEEIIVTAKQRAESLQAVPLTISAFTAADIADKGITDSRDLSRLTPSFYFHSGSGRAEPTQTSMRGVSPQTSASLFQGISFFIDGVPLVGELTSVDPRDMERVEVIKGPQSALFGRATYAGAVNYITKSPKTEKITGSINAGISRQKIDNSHDLALAINTPVVTDKLWVGLGATTMRRGALYKNAYNGEGLGVEATEAAKLQVQAEPNDRTSIRIYGNYTYDHDGASHNSIYEPQDWINAGSNVVTLPSGVRWVVGKVMNPTPVGGGNEFTPEPAQRTRNRYFLGGQAQTEIGGGHILSYRGGLNTERISQTRDSFQRSGVNDPVFGSSNNVKLRALQGNAAALASIPGTLALAYIAYDSWSHELRLASADNLPFRYQGGISASYQSQVSWLRNRITAATPTGQVNGKSIFKNYAAFAAADYDFAGGFTLSAEARLAKENAVADECLNCITSSPRLSNDSTQFSPRITLKYAFTPENMVYALWAQGYKSARFDFTRRTAAEPERLRNIELGAKNQFWGGRLQVNVSGYYEKIDNLQAVVTILDPTQPPGGTFLISGTQNFGSGRVWGAEGQWTVRLMRGLTWGGGLAYNDFRYLTPVLCSAFGSTESPLCLPTETIKGKTTAGTPAWTGFTSLDYTFAVGGDYAMTLRADVSYVGKSFLERANKAYIGGAARVNTRVKFSAGQWDVSLYTRDLFDNKTAVGSGLSGSSACLFTVATRPADRCMSLTMPRGREVGLDANIRF